MSTREPLHAYGTSFDVLVESIANAMRASGFPSKHASATRSSRPVSDSELTGLLHALGMLLENLEVDLCETRGLRLRTSTNLAGFLSVYASSRRLVILFRAAQDAGLLSGRAAAEVDGDIDNLEELLLRPDDPRAIVEASRWLLHAAQPYRSQFPEAIQEGMRELSAMLQGSATPEDSI